MAIKLLRAKKDVFMEDGDCHLFATEGKWYEVTENYRGEVLFTDDRGEEHFYPYDEIDEDFWTIDFEKGFNYESSLGKVEILYSEFRVNGVGGYKVIPFLNKDILEAIVSGHVEVLKYSNQKETPLKKVKPSKEERPYENWKMSISQDKFQRCVLMSRIFPIDVEGISGRLDTDNNIFYYCVKIGEFLSAKVYPFNYPDGTIGYEFVKENKDARGYRPKSKPVTEDKYVFCPENIWGNFHWKDTPVAESSGDYDNPSILDVVESTRKGILASFGVPKDLLGQEEFYSTELKFNYPEYNIVEGSESLEEEFKTEWSDKHYDFNYTLTEEDIEKGYVKLDVYKVSSVWKTASRDESGALWHSLKTIARFGDKNPVEREIRALHEQVKGLARENGVMLK